MIDYFDVARAILFKYFRSRVRQDNSEDYIQQAAVNIWQFQKNFDEKRGSFASYAYWSVRKAVSQIDRQSDQNLSFYDEFDAGSMELNMNHLDLCLTLDKIDNSRNRSIMLRTLEGLSTTEISKEFGVSHQRVAQIYKKISSKINKNYEEEIK